MSQRPLTNIFIVVISMKNHLRTTPTTTIRLYQYFVKAGFQLRLHAKNVNTKKMVGNAFFHFREF